MNIPGYCREIPQRYRLEANQCKGCGKILFPPRLTCPNCKSREFEKIKLTGEGEIVTYTNIYVGPKRFQKETPYLVAIIKLREGLLISAQVVDCEPHEVKIGLRVKAEFRKISENGKQGIICYGYKFVPA